MYVTKKDALKLAKHFKIDLTVVPIEIYQYGLNVEMEHGSNFGSITNVTKNNLLLTGKIVLAHLLETPDYYQRLKRMERAADKYWETHTKKSVIKRT